VLNKLSKERDENELHNSLQSDNHLAAHAAATGEKTQGAVDAEVQALGRTITDTGQLVVPKPDRLAADEKAILPKAGTAHEEATKEPSEADELTAEKNVGDAHLRRKLS
jgi:hypothetical protein